MPSASTLAACVAAMAAAVLAACSVGVTEESRGTSAVVLPAPALEAARPPRALLALVTNLGVVDDAARTGEWTVAQARLGDVVREWAMAKPSVFAPSVFARGEDGRADHAAEVDLASLQVGLAMHDAFGSRTAALSFDRVVADVLGRYLSVVPPDVLRLDTDLRRVRLDADVGDWVAARRDVDGAGADWARVEPIVGAFARSAANAPHAVDARQDVVQAIDRVRSAISREKAAEIPALAELALQEVNSLRRLWAQDGDISP